MVPAAGDDEGALRPLLSRDDAVLVLVIYPLRLHDGQAANGTCMPAKDMGTSSGLEIPDPDRTVRGATDECVLRRGKRPYASVVAVQ